MSEMNSLGRGKTISFVGPLPPPVHGFAAVNEAVCGLLRKNGFTVLVFDRHEPIVRYLDARALHAVRTLSRWISVFLRFLRCQLVMRNVITYVGVSGGRGKWLELPFVAVARSLRRPLVFHHHSFAYLHGRDLAAAFLYWFGGKGAVHVVLCGEMGRKLCRHYDVRGSQLRIVSNAAFDSLFGDSRPAEEAVPGRENAFRVGYLSAVSFEKGVDRFFEIADKLAESVPDIEFVAVGPILESDRARLELAFDARANCTWLGPLYRGAKFAFLDEVDVLLFPSRYVNEAEPVTLLEAAQCGCLSVATRRGCVCEAEYGGFLVVNPEASYVERAVHEITRLHERTRQERDQLRTQRRARAVEFMEEARVSLTALLDELSDLNARGGR